MHWVVELCRSDRRISGRVPRSEFRVPTAARNPERKTRNANLLPCLLGLVLTLALPAPARAADVLINEIMYHPLQPVDGPEPVAEEFIELFNRGTNAVDLTSWRLSKGVDFTFPSNTVIAPGGYLAVAANLTAFAVKYPTVSNVVGNWTGTLANNGEQIQLDNALGQQEDEVDYATQGDWAIRQRGPNDLGHYGWEWYAAHDGLGRSLELINPNQSNRSGQNWAASLTANGTPGRSNSVLATNIAPLILSVTHSPLVPTSSDAVTITAQVDDEATNGVTVTLYYRLDANPQTNPFATTNLFDDGAHGDGIAGDRLYGAILPARANNTVVEFYVQAADTLAQTRTWPAAARQTNDPTSQNFAQTCNALYQVDDAVNPATQPLLRLIMTEIERAELAAIPGQSTLQGPNSQMNGTFIHVDAAGAEVRYRCGFRNRGHGSRTANPPNYRVNFPNDTRWHGRRAIALNTQFTHVQVVGATVFQHAGLPLADSRPVQVRVNNVNRANAGASQYGSYALNEELDGEFAENHFPDDDAGNVYRGVRDQGIADLSWRSPGTKGAYVNSYFKQNNTSADDWSDLIHLTEVLSLTNDANYLAELQRVVDVDNWLLYFALHTLGDNNETSLSNGNGDDYAMFFGRLDPRCRLMAYDVDSIFGNQGSSATASLFRMTGNQPAIARFINHPEILPRYFGTLQRLMNTTLSLTNVGPLFDRAASGFPQTTALQNAIAAMKTYVTNRNAYVASQIQTNFTLTSNLPLVNGYRQTTNATAPLGGTASVIDTRAVLINGTPATWTPTTGRWTNNAVPLRPGLNRVLVQVLGPSSLALLPSPLVEVTRGTIDIWYEDGSTTAKGDHVEDSETWTAAAGPYLINQSIIVDPGVTLTIEPGTTIYMPAGFNFTVQGTLIATGTPTQRIRFTRPPGTTGAWGGLAFVNSPGDNQIAYADIEFADSGTNNVYVANSALTLDNVTWSATSRTILELNNAALDARNSTFPGLTNTPVIRGVGLPANGYLVIESNTFNAVAQAADVIEFTGAARPGPIVQVLNNTFLGSGDDVLDLRGADAHVEGNAFLRVHKNNAVANDTSSAIAARSGLFNGTNRPAQVVAARNLFVDVDHVALCRDGASLTLANNTALGLSLAALNFSEPGLGGTPGAGAALDGNIFWNPSGYSGTNFANLTAGVALTVDRSILWATDGLTNGAGNLNTDPRLANPNPATITGQTVRRDLSLRAGSPAIGTGPNGLDRGGLVPAGASLSGEPASPTYATSATLTVGGPGITHYQWRLNGGPFSAETPVGTPITLSGLANGSYTVTVLGKNSAGVYQDLARATVSRPWTVDTAFARVLLHEVLARNLTTLSVAGETPDLIELYNAGPAAVNLGGLGLTDDPDDPFKFTFPPGLNLDPGDYLVLYADNPGGPGLFTGFGLDQGGDSLFLYDAPGRGGALLDSVTFGPQIPDYSIGRLADRTWALTRPTFGAANVPQPTGEILTLKINEWLADGQGIFDDDFIELYNPDPSPVNLAGLYLTDAPQGAPTRHAIVPLSFVSAGGFVAFLADGDTGAGGNHLSFGLSRDQGQIALFAPDLTLIDSVFYGTQYPGTSEGRRPSGSGNFSFLSPPTPGAGNPGTAGGTVVTNISLPLLAMNSVWTYDQWGTNLGTAWKETNYSDALWSNGPALLAVETPGVYAEPIRTTLWLTPPGGASQVITYYFRAHFSVTQDLTGYTLTASVYLDDGAVFYLNGAEVGRIRVTANPVLFNSLASGSPPTEGALETVNFPVGALVPGDNVIAVEVHQQSTGSTDVAFGLSLAATRSVTNTLGVSVVLNEVLANNLNVENPDGRTSDWVELYNPSASVADLSGMFLSDDLGAPQRWQFPAGVTLPPGGYLTVYFDNGRPASTNNEPLLNTGFPLGAGGDEVYLFDTAARNYAQLDAVVFGVQAADFSIGRVPNGSGAWALTLPTRGLANVSAPLGNVNNVRLNEWLANPKPGEDDWFELYNPNSQPVALGGYFLTDRPNNRTKSPIPALSFLGTSTNGFVKFIADGQPENGANHADFSLDGGGEAIVLYPPGTAPAIDRVDFGAQEEDVSEGRLPDGRPGTSYVRFPTTATPGESNYLPLENVVISEALTHSDPPFEDAIELRNQSDDPVDVGGWFLSDSRDDLRKYRIADGTVIPAGGFLVIYEYQFNPNPGFFPNFALSSANGDQIYLSAADALGNFTGYRGVVRFGPAANGVSFGRYETSAGPDFPALSARSFGADNPATLAEFRAGAGLPNAYPLVGPVVLNEVHYHPPDALAGTNLVDNVADEFVELWNLSGGAVSLFDTNYPTNTWRLRDAVDFEFPPNTTLPAGGYLLLVSFAPTNTPLLDAFRAKYNLAALNPQPLILGPYRGKLDNGGESVELYQPDPPQLTGSDAGDVPYVLVDRVKYDDTTPWPSLADGNTNGVGVSLQRRVAADYGNDPVNWLAGVPTPGAATGPAVTNLPVITTPPTNVATVPGATVSFTVTASGAAPLRYQWRFNGALLRGATNATLSLPNVQAEDAGRYAVLVSNPAGAVSSVEARLNFQAPPVITQQPQSLVVAAGQTANFSVIAVGSSPLRYQWRKNTAPIGGATNATLSLPNAQSGDQADYTVVVTNNYGAVTSAVATLTINSPPGITSQPQDQTVVQGGTASFSVTAGGSAPLRYQWRRNGVNLGGETNDTLTLPSVQTNQAGSYTVVVTNFVGSVTSAVATLTVIPLPVVTIAATIPSVVENSGGVGRFTVTRSVVTNADLTVNFSVGGSAGPGVDYVALTSPATIPAGAASATLDVAPMDDPTAEPSDTVIITVTSGAGYVVGAPASATVTILDDDNLPPSVTITNPPDALVLPAVPTNVTVSAAASDSDGTVTRVDFFVEAPGAGRVAIGTDTTAPFSALWTNVPAGTNVLTAVATDNFGLASTSAPVTVFGNFAPTVSLTSPASGANFPAPANVTLTANASDPDGSVTRVEFFAGTNSLGQLTNTPWTIQWTNVAAGNYSLTARATDDRGVTRTSAVVSITVGSNVLAFTDHFTNRNVVSGSPLTVTGSNAGTTAEPGEPNPAGLNRNSRTVWIAWRATYSGSVTIDTIGSSFDTVLGVYTGTVLSSLTVIDVDDDGGGNNASLITFNAVAGTTYNVQVAGFNNNFRVGNITLHITAAVPVPTITAQPQSQTVPRGSNATFNVTVSGATPLSYQWRFNGAPIEDATSSVLTVKNVQVFNEGAYSVVVTNAFGSATSSNATLTVDDGLVSVQRVRWVDFTTPWSYQADTNDLGTAWRQPGFNDSAWPEGAALLGFETTPTVYPEPFRTTLNLSNGPTAILTFYFRTHFTFTNGGARVTLLSTNYVDDGAAFYLNGQEMTRVRIAAGTISYSTLAQLGTEGVADVLTLPATNLVVGDNVLAVEVHQNTAGSSDIVFGMTLDATITVTNQPVLISAQMLGNGDFQVTLDGVAGRVYAIDSSTNLTSWTPLTTFTNATGQTVITDTSHAGTPRFYRGRLVR
jgi:hypothetical protein